MVRQKKIFFPSQLNFSEGTYFGRWKLEKKLFQKTYILSSTLSIISSLQLFSFANETICCHFLSCKALDWTALEICVFHQSTIAGVAWSCVLILQKGEFQRKCFVFTPSPPPAPSRKINQVFTLSLEIWIFQDVRMRFQSQSINSSLLLPVGICGCPRLKVSPLSAALPCQIT